MLIVGLTGGIASGKSTVCAIFKKAGAAIIDADVLARRVVAPGWPAWREIKSRFGDKVFKPDETIDRALLGDMVFEDQSLRVELERIVHPRVREQMNSEMDLLRKTSPKSLVVKDIPLMFESGMTEGLAEIIVVYVPEQLQISRLIHRDGIGLEAARARINAQMPMEKKRRLGTMVIDNSGDLASTEKQVLKIYTKLGRRAREDVCT